MVIRAGEVPGGNRLPGWRTTLAGKTGNAERPLHSGHDGGFRRGGVGGERGMESGADDPQEAVRIGWPGAAAGVDANAKRAGRWTGNQVLLKALSVA
jgi:hypothetical protein